MVELGQLEKHYAEFDRRHVHIIAISNDDQETARATQADFPHLIVVADTELHMATAMQVLHPGAGPTGADTNAPTTFLVDDAGVVRWMFRPDRFIVRLSAEELLTAVDKTWPRE
jgi:alkyl hydroperoxide reductase subunit AhpC